MNGAELIGPTHVNRREVIPGDAPIGGGFPYRSEQKPRAPLIHWKQLAWAIRAVELRECIAGANVRSDPHGELPDWFLSWFGPSVMIPLVLLGLGVRYIIDDDQ